MCDPNENILFNMDFSSGSDETNWTNSTSTPIQTISGKLQFPADVVASGFTRDLGTIDPANNKIRLQLDFEIFRPVTSDQSTFCAEMEIFVGGSSIGSFSLYLDAIANGQLVNFNFDRLYSYEGVSGTVTLKISVVEGFKNTFALNYLYSKDLKFCNDNVRTYFVIDQFLANAINSVSSGIQLLEWKVDDVETLTSAFFTEMNSPGGDPTADWKIAKAYIDGTDRNADLVDPNTFNPFVTEFGLDFADVAGNHFGGKPTGVTSGSDYGSGIMQIGFEKPEILNEILLEKNGAFFIDIDFTKSLRVSFHVLVNNTNADVFDSPDIYRTYVIKWDVTKCKREFFYTDQLSEDPNPVAVDVMIDGFLSGLTDGDSKLESLLCGESRSFDGQNGVIEFEVDFGANVGTCGLDYDVENKPEKIEIIWNGQLFSSGYVGHSDYDQDLINAGVNPSEIQTNDPSTGVGSLTFIKTLASPAVATVRVISPLIGRNVWQLTTICPDGTILEDPLLSLTTDETNVSVGSERTFTIASSDPDGTIDSWTIDFGGEQTVSGSGATPPTIDFTFNTPGKKTVKMSVTDNDGRSTTKAIEMIVEGDTVFTLSGVSKIGCGGGTMSGTLVVTSGFVWFENEFTVLDGTPVSADINIDSKVIGAGTRLLLGAGSYPFTSTAIDCTNGNGTNELKIL